MAERLMIKDLLRDTIELAVRTRISSAAILVFLVATYSLAELEIGDDALFAAYGVLGLASLYLQLFLTSEALSYAPLDYDFEWRRPTKGRFPSFVLLTMAWLLASAVGLLLLVIPGLIFMVRWSLAAPALLAEDTAALDALRRSWELTRRHWKAAALVFAIGLSPMAPAVALDFHYPDSGPPPVGLALATNALYATSSIISWLMVCALYAAIVMRSRDMAA